MPADREAALAAIKDALDLWFEQGGTDGDDVPLCGWCEQSPHTRGCELGRAYAALATLAPAPPPSAPGAEAAMTEGEIQEAIDQGRRDYLALQRHHAGIAPSTAAAAEARAHPAAPGAEAMRAACADALEAQAEIRKRRGDRHAANILGIAAAHIRALPLPAPAAPDAHAEEPSSGTALRAGGTHDDARSVTPSTGAAASTAPTEHAAPDARLAEAALRFYAAPETYEPVVGECGRDEYGDSVQALVARPPIDDDQGAIARAALASSDRARGGEGA
jgi:hypothetical protein